MSVTTELVRRYIENARSAQGMRVGMPKVTMCASIAERLCIEAENAEQNVTDEQIERAVKWWMRENYDSLSPEASIVRAMFIGAFRAALHEDNKQ